MAGCERLGEGGRMALPLFNSVVAWYSVGGEGRWFSGVLFFAALR